MGWFHKRQNRAICNELKRGREVLPATRTRQGGQPECLHGAPTTMPMPVYQLGSLSVAIGGGWAIPDYNNHALSIPAQLHQSGLLHGAPGAWFCSCPVLRDSEWLNRIAHNQLLQNMQVAMLLLLRALAEQGDSLLYLKLFLSIVAKAEPAAFLTEAGVRDCARPAAIALSRPIRSTVSNGALPKVTSETGGSIKDKVFMIFPSYDIHFGSSPISPPYYIGADLLDYGFGKPLNGLSGLRGSVPNLRPVFLDFFPLP